MISDNLIQADLIAKLKSITSVTSVLGDGVSGVKELEWQGDEFTYPCVRLELEDAGYEMEDQENCGLYFCEFSIYTFSQERSSKQCSQIKGMLETALSGLGFTGTYAKFNRLRLLESIPAVREDSRTWRTQLRYRTRLTEISSP